MDRGECGRLRRRPNVGRELRVLDCQTVGQHRKVEGNAAPVFVFHAPRCLCTPAVAGCGARTDAARRDAGCRADTGQVAWERGGQGRE